MNNKWTRAAIPALLLHVSIGTVYCWSVFSGTIADSIGTSKSNIEWAFSLAIFFLGMSAAFLGKIVEKNIKLSSLIAAICFSVGMAGTGISIHFKSLIGIYFFYGIVMGIGLGVGYLTPVKNLMLWFSKNKGLGTGLAVAGFGLAKMIAAPVMELLLGSVGLTPMFLILGGVYLVMMLGGFLLIKRPDSYLAAVKAEQEARAQNPDAVSKPDSLLTIIKNPSFLGIWLMFFLNITCGLALISQEKNILKIVLGGAGSTEASLAAIIAVVLAINAAFNAIGRLGFSTLSDRFRHRESSYIIIFAMSLVITLVLALSNGIDNKFVWLVLPLLFIVNAGYGGGFSTLPVLLHQHFGMKNISTIHGLTLSAWAFAGLTGNQLSSLIVNTMGLSYTVVVSVMCVLYAVSLAICILLLLSSRKKPAHVETH